MSDPVPCILCDAAAKWSNVDGLRAICNCERCGEYDVSVPLRQGLRTQEARDKVPDRYLVSGFTREQFEKWKHGAGARIDAPRFIGPEDIARVAALAPRRIPDRTFRLLSAIDRRMSYFGEAVPIDLTTDYSLAYARNAKEFDHIIRFAAEQGWITYDAAGGLKLTLTAGGLWELEGRAGSNLDSERVFVAMWFDPALDPAWERGIAPAVQAAGFRPLRIDLEQHNDDINDRVKAEIRRSRFVVADFTGHRNGVYFEAGFALGLSLPVVWMCRKDHFNGSHFDTNHYNHIVWEVPDGIVRPLRDRIIATIGFGPLDAK